MSCRHKTIIDDKFIRVHVIATLPGAHKFPCTLYHLLLEEAKDPATFSGNHGLMLLRLLDKAKGTTPAEWMAAASPEGGGMGEGNGGWMHPVAVQADFHVARWTRRRDELSSTPEVDEDPTVQAALSHALAAHRSIYPPDVTECDEFWRLGVMEGGLAMYARLHPRVNAVTSRGPGPTPLSHLNGGGGGHVAAFPLTTLSAGLRQVRNYLFDGNGPVDVFCEYVVRVTLMLSRLFMKEPEQK